MRDALIHSEDWTRFDYGPEHPLRMERLGLTWRLMEAYGLTALPGCRLSRPIRRRGRDRALPRPRVPRRPPGLEQRARRRAVACRFGLGPGDNPVFPGMWDAARLVAAGGSLLGARAGRRAARVARAFHFAGGLHHAMRDRASGFCYVNDAVLAILCLRARGLRVAYIDIDAHHGDGVQAAFYDDPNVLTVSTHERGERLFPGTGFVRRGGRGRRGRVLGEPAPRGVHDSADLPAGLRGRRAADRRRSSGPT